MLTAIGLLTALTTLRARNAARTAAGETVVPIGQNPQVVAARGTLAGLANRAAQRLDPHQQTPQATQQSSQQPQPTQQATQPGQQPAAPRQWTMLDQG